MHLASLAKGRLASDEPRTSEASRGSAEAQQAAGRRPRLHRLWNLVGARLPGSLPRLDRLGLLRALPGCRCRPTGRAAAADPAYADAHLAAYQVLDPRGPWASVARRRLDHRR
jgi:hypothetical protein